MADVVLRLEREKLQVLVEAASAWMVDEDSQNPYSIYGSPLLRAAVSEARAALDSPPVEEREYRVVADFAAEGDQSITLVGPGDIEASENMHREAVASYRHGGVYKNPQAQSRTITTFSDGSTFTSPWTDLSGEGEQ